MNALRVDVKAKKEGKTKHFFFSQRSLLENGIVHYSFAFDTKGVVLSHDSGSSVSVTMAFIKMRPGPALLLAVVSLVSPCLAFVSPLILTGATQRPPSSCDRSTGITNSCVV